MVHKNKLSLRLEIMLNLRSLSSTYIISHSYEQWVYIGREQYQVF